LGGKKTLRGPSSAFYERGLPESARHRRTISKEFGDLDENCRKKSDSKGEYGCRNSKGNTPKAKDARGENLYWSLQ